MLPTPALVEWFNIEGLRKSYESTAPRKLLEAVLSTMAPQAFLQPVQAFNGPSSPVPNMLPPYIPSTQNCFALPTELWAAILPTLPKPDLMSCALVNSIFHSIALPALWTTFSLGFIPQDRSPPSGTYMRDDIDVVKARGADKARTLEGFYDLIQSSPHLYQIIETLYLESLDYPSSNGGAAFGYVNPVTYLSIIQALPNLHTLRLTDVFLSGDLFRLSYHQWPARTTLSALSLAFIKPRRIPRNSEFIWLLPALLSPFKSIHTLYLVDRVKDEISFSVPTRLALGRVEITVSERMYGLASMPRSALRGLHILPSSPSTDYAIEYVIDYLRGVGSGLTTLSLGANLFKSSNNPDRIIDMLALCPNLRSLTVYLPLPERQGRSWNLSDIDMCRCMMLVPSYLAKPTTIPLLRRFSWMIQGSEVRYRLFHSAIEDSLFNDMDEGLKELAMKRPKLLVGAMLADMVGRVSMLEGVSLAMIFPKSAKDGKVRML